MVVMFATVGDLGAYRGEDITDNARATLLIESASALIQAYTGQTIAEVAADTLLRPGTRDSEIILPQRPVTAVASVAIDGTTLAAGAYTWYRNGRLRRPDAGDFGGPTSTITVVYTHGYPADEIPGDVRGVTLQVASRAWDNPSAVQSQGVGDYSVVYGINPAGGIILTDKERDQLRPYRTRVRSVEIST